MSLSLPVTDLRVERGTWMHRVMRSILGVPLVGKLIGANVIIVASAIALQASAFQRLNNPELVTALVALAAASAVNLFLVRLALKPIDELEQLAERVSAGEFEIRGSPSRYADKDLSKLSETVNALLDSLAAERSRIQNLGADVVRAQDVERAQVSRELHDSIAQTLAAVRLQLAAAARDDDASSIKNRVAAANAMISAAMDEIMSVSYSLHSRVAEDLGLHAALGTLARQFEERSGALVEVIVSPHADAIPPAESATLYRVAEEALREMEVQGEGKTATVKVETKGGVTRLEVVYESRPLPGASIRPGLASVKDRVLLAGGAMKIENQNGGTRVTAELRTMKAAS